MKFREYGKKGQPIIVMIHGEYATGWNYEEQSLLLSEHFFVVVPEWEQDQDFKSIEQCAQEIEQYLNEKKYGRIAILIGTGIGGLITIKILSENPFLCSDCILESVPLLNNQMIMPKFLFTMTKIPFIIRYNAYRYRIPFEKYEQFRINQKQRTYETYTNILQSKKTFQLPKLYRVQAKTLILVGNHENKRAQKSAQLLYRSLIDSELEYTKTKISGEFSRNTAQYCVVRLMKLYQSIL